LLRRVDADKKSEEKSTHRPVPEILADLTGAEQEQGTREDSTKTRLH